MWASFRGKLRVSRVGMCVCVFVHCECVCVRKIKYCDASYCRVFIRFHN